MVSGARHDEPTVHTSAFNADMPVEDTTRNDLLNSPNSATEQDILNFTYQDQTTIDNGG